MSRSALAAWSRRVRRKAACDTAAAFEADDAIEAAVETAARRLKLDPTVLLGVLAAEPPATAVWAEVRRCLRCESGCESGDWSELSAAAAVVGQSGRNEISCWVAEPARSVDALATASCLVLAAQRKRVSVVVTHSDPLVAEIGRSGLVSEAALRTAPGRNREAHFRKLERCWQAVPALRTVLRFETPALLPDVEGEAHRSSGGFDLIVSRGVLSRLSPQPAGRLAQRLRRMLRSGGFLLVGPGEHDTPLLDGLVRFVAPGVLLYRKVRSGHSTSTGRSADEGRDFAALLADVEANPMAWQPRWQLARVLLREGHAEPALVHLREVIRRQPNDPAVWRVLAQAYTLLDDAPAADAARQRAAESAAVANAA